jgi:hypothetical protein
MMQKAIFPVLFLAVVGVSPVQAEVSINPYGFVDIGIEQFQEEGLRKGADVYAGGGSANGNTDGQEFALTNNVHSRLGVYGEEATTSGWKGTYKLEFKADVLQQDGYGLQTRLGWLGLEHGQHSFKVGTQWSLLMQYSGWNTARAESQGMASYFYVTDELQGSLAYGFRNDSTVSYTYGNGGWGAAAPVTASIALHIGDDQRRASNEELSNDAGITGISMAGATTFGALTLNAVLVKNLVAASEAAQQDVQAARLSGDEASLAQAQALLLEPAVYGVGAKWQAKENLEVGLAYRLADRDTEQNAITSSTSLAGQYQASQKLNLHLGMGRGEDEDDNARQLELNLYGQLSYQLTSSRQLRFEFDHADYGDDGRVMATLFSMRQSF